MDSFENSSRSNGDRAASGLTSIRHYGQQPGMDEDDVTLSIDLITDVLHFLHSGGMDVEQALRMAKGHYEAKAARAHCA